MPLSSYSLPETVTLGSAKMVADDVLRHVNSCPSPLIKAMAVQQAGVPLLQILIAAKRRTEALGKPFEVHAPPDGALHNMLLNLGLDPAVCGLTADLPPAPDMQRTDDQDNPCN